MKLSNGAPWSIKLLCSGALALGIAATASPAVAADGFLFTSDYGNHRIRIADLASGLVVYDLDMQTSRISPICGASWSGCVPMGFQYLRSGDKDFVDVAVTYTDFGAGQGSFMVPTFIGRYELSTVPRRVFTLDYMDFRDVPGYEDYCAQGPEEAYGPATSWSCRMQLVHALGLVKDDPANKVVSYVVADAFNARVMQLTLDYNGGNNVAHVDWVLTTDHPEFPVGGLPNGVRYIDDPEGPFILVTYYSTGELPGASAGALQLFRVTDTGLEGVWRFPEVGDSTAPWLHAPHMGQILTDPVSGRRWLFYSHGRALASNWGTSPNTDLGGSVGVMKLGSSLTTPPVYMGEAVPYLDEALADPTQPPYRYARDVEFTDQGEILFTDASCENSCPEPGQHFLVENFLDTLTASPLTGVFSSTHEQQALVGLEGASVKATLQCGHDGAFESHWVSQGGVGRDLRAAQRKATVSCAAESEPPAEPEPTPAPVPQRRR